MAVLLSICLVFHLCNYSTAILLHAPWNTEPLTKYFWREELKTRSPPYTHWVILNKVWQQRKHLNLACELYQHGHVVFYRTSSANYKVSQIKVDCLIHLRTLQKNSVIFLENETTTLVMDATILPQVCTRHSSPVLELWRHHHSQFASAVKSQGRGRNNKMD